MEIKYCLFPPKQGEKKKECNYRCPHHKSCTRNKNRDMWEKPVKETKIVETTTDCTDCEARIRAKVINEIIKFRDMENLDEYEVGNLNELIRRLTSTK